MSLFIGALALSAEQQAIKIGVLSGSIVSALSGWLILRFAPAKRSSLVCVRHLRRSPKTCHDACLH